jgi:hypothetical protein
LATSASGAGVTKGGGMTRPRAGLDAIADVKGLVGFVEPIE